MKKQRDISLDVAKALGMLMIVSLHVRLYASATPPRGVSLWVDNFCCTSCLPVFFMLSGRFSRTLFEQGDWRKLLMRLTGYLWPVMIFFAILGTLIGFALYGYEKPALVPFVRGILLAGWFFGCLAVCDAVTFVAYRLARGRLVAVIGWLALSYLILWLLPIGLFHACRMLPFFWLGLFVMPRMETWRYRAVVGFAALFVSLVICAMGIDLHSHIAFGFHFGEMSLRTFTVWGFALAVWRMFFGALGAVGFFELVRMGVARLPALGRLAVFGTETLGIFFVHTQLLKVYYDCGWMGWYGGGLAARLLLALVFFVVSYGLVRLINANRWIRALVWNPLFLVQSGNRGKGR